MSFPAFLAVALSLMLLVRSNGPLFLEPLPSTISAVPLATIKVARANGAHFGQAVWSARRVLHAWLRHADPRTGLLPDHIDPNRDKWIYTPHNSGADLYPYLLLTAQLTDPDIYQGQMLKMLRNEVRYTSTRQRLPGDLIFVTQHLGPPSLFGAGEYAKDGLVSVTEYLGRTPWFYRMIDLTADAMAQATVDSRYGKLPAFDAELNGDFLQILTRLAPMTGDPRFLEWARRLGDAYIDEVLPGNFGVPSMNWDFGGHTGDGRLRFRDHGNEIIVGLMLLFGIEEQLGSDRARHYQAALQRMIDRILESTAPDGMLYNEVDAKSLAPIDRGFSDNWGYVYGAIYMFYQLTGDAKYRNAVRRVLASLPAYRNFAWEPGKDSSLGSFDGYADSIESAIYLVNREPIPEALAWIDSEMQVMLSMQRADGHIEDWYAEGNFNRTALLYAYMKSLGARPLFWRPGVRVGAARDGGRLVLSVAAAEPIRIQFDFARHKRVLNFKQNFARLNEFPEWFTVDENSLYRVGQVGTPGEVWLGSELIAGVMLHAGEWIVEPLPQN